MEVLLRFSKSEFLAYKLTRIDVVAPMEIPFWHSGNSSARQRFKARVLITFALSTSTSLAIGIQCGCLGFEWARRHAFCSPPLLSAHNLVRSSLQNRKGG